MIFALLVGVLGKLQPRLVLLLGAGVRLEGGLFLGERLALFGEALAL